MVKKQTFLKELCALHIRIPNGLDIRIDEAVLRERKRTHKRVTRVQLLTMWIEEGLKRHKSKR